MRMEWKDLPQCRRIIVKVGTSTLVRESGTLDYNSLDDLVRRLAKLQNEGRQVVLVSSGAIGAGMGKMNLNRRPADISSRQALAAIGQGLLMHSYEQAFSRYGIKVAQVLLTREDVSNRTRYLNARNTLNRLLDYDVLPIINENDTVAFEQIKFGDNDTLAAMVASLVDADLLILLTDIDSLYSADPRTHPEAERIATVTDVTAEIEAMAGGMGSRHGTGGMVTKLEAARMANSEGIPVVMAHGRSDESLLFLEGKPVKGTFFQPREFTIGKRKCWLAFNARPQGKLMIDDGAAHALQEGGKSLLPSGITDVQGAFLRGSVVAVVHQGKTIARGIVNYSSDQMLLIKGHQSGEIPLLLGDDHEPEAVHRDNLALC